jgi:hypothetical protein
MAMALAICQIQMCKIRLTYRVFLPEKFEVLKGKNATLTFDLVRECLKTKSLEKDHVPFRTTCKVTVNQVVTSLNITISTLKEVAKSNEKLKQTLFKLTDVKYKDTFTLYQKNLKVNMKLPEQIQDVHKKLNVHVITISNLNHDIMGKIRECDGLKKENKVLTSKVTSLQRKSLEVDEWKMEHALQFIFL